MSSIEPAAIESSATGCGGTVVGSGAGAGGSGGGVTVVEPVDGGGGIGRAMGGFFFEHAPAVTLASNSKRIATLRTVKVFIACSLLPSFRPIWSVVIACLGDLSNARSIAPDDEDLRLARTRGREG